MKVSRKPVSKINSAIIPEIKWTHLPWIFKYCKAREDEHWILKPEYNGSEFTLTCGEKK